MDKHIMFQETAEGWRIGKCIALHGVIKIFIRQHRIIRSDPHVEIQWLGKSPDDQFHVGVGWSDDLDCDYRHRHQRTFRANLFLENALSLRRHCVHYYRNENQMIKTSLFFWTTKALMHQWETWRKGSQNNHTSRTIQVCFESSFHRFRQWMLMGQKWRW